MSKLYESYIDSIDIDRDRDIDREEPEVLSNNSININKLSKLSEIEKCKYYGIQCSYNICSECDIY